MLLRKIGGIYSEQAYSVLEDLCCFTFSRFSISWTSGRIHAESYGFDVSGDLVHRKLSLTTFVIPGDDSYTNLSCIEMSDAKKVV